MNRLQFNQTTVSFIKGDITRCEIDAIVNAANESLLGGGGVDGAIHRAAGAELLAACRLLNGCRTGEAKLTPGFRLKAAHVIHTVGPIWRGGMHGEAELLASCYRKSLELAEANGIRTLAFPAISTGIYGYPLEQATSIAIGTIKAYLIDYPQTSIKEITFVCFDDATLRAYEQAFKELERGTD
ncbi:O-acetyl-ADP-ribose deacetylase [uncultured Trichococcus sp.]|uniref:O-acetyl-ADP-ribose deacetylase n=1 Tax=uncultured Trichococcus sp. TaxID=189665 RepID=UPI0029C9A28B|nr:O-acetyl-ADP-ribose deacetylase [uncultured Trichococcus sp.]